MTALLPTLSVKSNLTVAEFTETHSQSSTSDRKLGADIRAVLPPIQTDRTHDEVLAKAIYNLKNRISQGDRSSSLILAKIYFEESLYPEAAECLNGIVTLANEHTADDVAEAMYLLALLSYEGLANNVNYELAFEYMSKVAARGEPQWLLRAAQYNIGCAYYSGLGVTQSDSEAEKWWTMAANDGSKHGNVKAMTALGFYYSGKLHQDLEKSYCWHHEAAQHGSVESGAAVGVMFLYGVGTKMDDVQAYRYLTQASSRGNVYASAVLITIFFKRKLHRRALELAGSLIDVNDCVALARHLDCEVSYVKKGVAIACFYYARMHERGMGVTKDKQKANQYFAKAIAHDADVAAYLQQQAAIGEI